MLSIVLPVVKTDYFEEALRSILNQTYTDFELIIVDNQADPGFEAILERNADSRIIVRRHQKRVPIIENWNLCASYASRRYLMLFSDDDTMEEHCIEEFMQLIVNYPDSKIFHSRVCLTDEAGIPNRLTSSAPELESGLNYIYEGFVFGRTQLVSDFLWDRKFFIENGAYESLPGAWGSDEATTYKIAHLAKEVVYAANPLVNVRVNPVNFTNTMHFETQLNAVCHFDKWMRSFLETVQPEYGADIRYKTIRREYDQILDKRYTGCFINLAMRGIVFSALLYRFKHRKKLAHIRWKVVFTAMGISLYKRLNRIKHHRD